ncbi:trans-aconitate 2-methyltransferase [Sphingomonas alpina]|uniref:Trans-aconitate 2-methyltransferase n=1 Tax=Sphingomonas alpina TaxID=653931 RepID=A0A7H0LF76_9SPHN|nr:trans-aconitate 2-methyltransferase [Sphingomonas alpina]QNQ08329.1 trans-aconitate 2-methyltransferase [Sphingomonas alpina]
MSWSAAQYVRFEAERNRPIHDLLARIPMTNVRRGIDIGCGPGNSTELLQARFPSAELSGIDSSADMIAAACKRLPAVHFAVEDIADWHDPGRFDLILANAALQWVPDHATLLPALIGRLAPGGSLAVQIPDNLDEPAHQLMRDVAAEGPWAATLAGAGAAHANRHSPDWYHRALYGRVAGVDIWRTVYYHQLAGGPGAIVEWFKGTGLRPFLDRLDDVQQTAFLERYGARIATAYPAFADGMVLFPFPRLFIVATRGT